MKNTVANISIFYKKYFPIGPAIPHLWPFTDFPNRFGLASGRATKISWVKGVGLWVGLKYLNFARGIVNLEFGI